MKVNRTITRENAMRVLYQIFLYKKNKIDYTTNGVIEEYMDNIPLEERKIINTELVEGVLNNINDIDNNISKYLENWTIDRLGLTDQAIIRISVYELLYTNTPNLVCINEAIELSKGMENIKYKVIAAEDIDYEENTFDAITACQCFWYFDSKIVVPKIKRILSHGGIFLKVYMSYMKEEDITQDSNEIVKQINNSWEGASPSIQYLKTHYFENPQMDTIIVDIPVTRESWHGRMLASRGVMAAMNEKQISEFGKRHMDMLCKKYPKQFTVKHKVFLTWYTMK